MNFSLEKLIRLLRKNFILILAVSLLCSVAMYYYKVNNTAPVYSSYTELYTNTNLAGSDDAMAGEAPNSPDQIGVELKYVGTYIEMLKTVKFAGRVYENLSEEWQAITSPSDIYGSLSIGTKNETAIIIVYVYSANQELSLKIAQAVQIAAHEYLYEQFNVARVETVEDARYSGVTSVSYKKSVLIGFILGALVAFFAVFVKDMYDHRLRNPGEIKDRYNLPVLGTVPTFDSKASVSKSKYKYKYNYKRGSRN